MGKRFVLLSNLVIFGLLFPTVSSLEYKEQAVSFDEAEIKCNESNKVLASLGGDTEMTSAIEYVYKNNLNDFWIGLKWNATENSYKWLDGELLGVANWSEKEPKNNGVGYCVYLNIATKKWHTASCNDTKKTICMASESQFSDMGENKDFDAASLKCTENNQNLPVFMSNNELQNFHSFAQSISTGDVWLGLIASGDYFQWLNGVPLAKYFWEEKSGESNTGTYIHAHKRKDEENPSTLNLLQIHAPNKISDNEKHRKYLCQTRSSSDKKDNLWVHYHYVIKLKNAIMNYAPRRIIDVTRKTHCAMECSKDIGCYRYTLVGKTCKTYGNVAFTKAQNGGGVRLYERIEVNTKL